MPESIADHRKVLVGPKRDALRQAGGQVIDKVTHKTELESPEVAASVGELAARAQLSDCQWPPGFHVLNTVETMAALHHWRQSPGSPESQHSLARLREGVQPVLDQADLEASICIPLASYQHWTWLCFRRSAKSASQTEPQKFHAVYRDSLKPPSLRCRDFAVLAMSMAVQLLGTDNVADWRLPAVEPDVVQTDNTSCGFHVINWNEMEFRRLRGEGL